MVSATGIGSGLDIEGLVRQLVNAERRPVENRLLVRERTLTSQLSGFGTLKGVLADLRNPLAALTNPATFQQRTVSSSDNAVAVASATGNAATASYTLAVSQLAASQSLASPTFAALDTPVGEGTLTFRFGTAVVTPPDSGPQTFTSFTADPDRAAATVTIDGGNNTLAGVRDAVNAAGIGVSAAIVKDADGYRLVFSANQTGAASSVEIAVTDAGDGNDTDSAGLSRLAFNPGAANLLQTAAARDAQFTLNGLPLTSDSNTLSNVLDGLSITLRGTSANPVSLSVAENRGAITAAISQFVTAFNAFIGTAANLTRFTPETGVAAPLQGDFSARNIINQVRSVVTGVNGSPDGALRSLAEIGITTTANGTLKLDEGRLQSVLEADTGQLAALFTQPEVGLGARLDTLLRGYLNGDGLLENRVSGLQGRIDRLGNDREALNRRLEALESRYRSQFNALDGLLARINSTGSFVSEQLAAIPRPSDRFSK